MVIGRDSDTQAATLDIKVHGDSLEVVSRFKYLGSIFSSDGCLDAKAGHCLVSAFLAPSARTAWHQLKARSLWCSKHLTLARKVFFCCSIVLSILLYGYEVNLLWKDTPSVFQMSCLRFLCGFLGLTTRQMSVLGIAATPPSIASGIRFRRMSWLGRVARMPDERLLVQVCLDTYLVQVSGSP